MGRSRVVNLRAAKWTRALGGGIAASMLAAVFGVVAATSAVAADEESPESAQVSTVLVIDSSGSMTGEDPDDRRLDAARAYLTASLPSDEVGVVDFDSSADVLSEAVPVGSHRDQLSEAIGKIDSSGGTDLGEGLEESCGVLTRATGEHRAAIFLTDGDGSYSDESKCFADEDWKVFTIGLGSGVDETVLTQIADDTGGNYRALSDADSLICAFQQIRVEITGGEPGDCEDTKVIGDSGRTSDTFEVPPHLLQITFTTEWWNAELGFERAALRSLSSLDETREGACTSMMTVTSETGDLRVDRDSGGQSGVVVEVGATHETFTIEDPEPGEWTIEWCGPPGTEFRFSTAAIEGDPPEDDETPDPSIPYLPPIPSIPTTTTTTTPDVAGDETVEVERLAGADRIGTSVEGSLGMGIGDDAAAGAVLASAADYADALVAGPLAHSLGGPLLLSDPGELPDVVADELARVLPDGATVHVVGGPSAISDEVAAQVEALGLVVQRVAGADRFETAVAVADLLDPAALLLTTGQDFADALVGSAAAIRSGGAVLLTAGDALPAVTSQWADGHGGLDRWAIGGPAAAADPTATPVAGEDRFATAVAVSEAFYDEGSRGVVTVASGLEFADALVGAVLAGEEGPLLLVPASAPLPSSLVEHLEAIVGQVDLVRALGGDAAVADGVVTAVADALSVVTAND